MSPKRTDDTTMDDMVPHSSVTSMNLKGLCSLCGVDCCIFRVSQCGHEFHMRCIPKWPICTCPKCGVPVEKLIPITSNSYVDKKWRPRTGKWTLEEERYVDTVIALFLKGELPCADGTSVRLLLSKVLNCTPMRLSKKFQRKALGKHTFHLPHSRCITHPEDHVENQRELSMLERQFHKQMMSSRKQSKEYDYINLRYAQHSFWLSQFILLAEQIGQSVEGYDFDLVSKKRQRRVKDIESTVSNVRLSTIIKSIVSPSLSVPSPDTLNMTANERYVSPTITPIERQHSPTLTPTNKRVLASTMTFPSSKSSTTMATPPSVEDVNLPLSCEDPASTIYQNDFIVPLNDKKSTSFSNDIVPFDLHDFLRSDILFYENMKMDCKSNNLSLSNNCHFMPFNDTSEQDYFRALGMEFENDDNLMSNTSMYDEIWNISVLDV